MDQYYTLSPLPCSKEGDREQMTLLHLILLALLTLLLIAVGYVVWQIVRKPEPDEDENHYWRWR